MLAHARLHIMFSLHSQCIDAGHWWCFALQGVSGPQCIAIYVQTIRASTNKAFCYLSLLFTSMNSRFDFSTPRARTSVTLLCLGITKWLEQTAGILSSIWHTLWVRLPVDLSVISGRQEWLSMLREGHSFVCLFVCLRCHEIFSVKYTIMVYILTKNKKSNKSTLNHTMNTIPRQ